MAKRRGNPNWGKPEPIGPVVPTVTSFEQVVKEFKLTPDQYVRLTRLREWARRNRNSKYIPEALLEALGIRNRIYFVKQGSSVLRNAVCGRRFVLRLTLNEPSDTLSPGMSMQKVDVGSQAPRQGHEVPGPRNLVGHYRWSSISNPRRK